MKTNAYLVVTTLVFSAVAVVHLLRFVMGWPAQIGTWNVPMWASLVAVMFSASFALWGWAAMLRRG